MRWNQRLDERNDKLNQSKDWTTTNERISFASITLRIKPWEANKRHQQLTPKRSKRPRPIRLAKQTFPILNNREYHAQHSTKESTLLPTHGELFQVSESSKCLFEGLTPFDHNRITECWDAFSRLLKENKQPTYSRRVYKRTFNCILPLILSFLLCLSFSPKQGFVRVWVSTPHEVNCISNFDLSFIVFFCLKSS
jgi:hypothetical protein